MLDRTGRAYAQHAAQRREQRSSPPPSDDDEILTFASREELFAFLAREIRTAHGGVKGHPRPGYRSFASFARDAQLSGQTVAKLAAGETHRPGYATIDGIMHAMGYEMVPRRIR